jgi:predicted nucleotidyltransferase
MNTKTFTADTENKERLLKLLTDILVSRDDILFAFVHGSFTGDLPFHDIDVAVYLSEVRETAVALDALDLSGRLGSELGVPVDLRPLNFAPIPFRYQAIRGRLLFEKDPDLTAQFIEQTIQRYLDMKPFLLTGMKEAFSA